MDRTEKLNGVTMMGLGRSIVLGIAANKAVTGFVTKHGMKLGAKRFIAGSTLQQAAEMVRELNREGLVVTLDHVGESVSTKQEAIAATNEAIAIFKIIKKMKLNSNVSVKLTQLGLGIDPEFCYENMDRIAATAKEHNNFVRIDIEDSPVTQITIDIFKRVLEKYGKEHVGLVLQSMLYRTEKDMEDMASLDVNIRMVKGAYKEPKEVAYPRKQDVDDNYLKMVKMHMDKGVYIAIASHDEAIINDLKKYAKDHNISKDKYEFQMLYGIKNGLQRQLVKEGYKVRVYTPYGHHWYPYFSRRLAERPANVIFILKNLFS